MVIVFGVGFIYENATSVDYGQDSVQWHFGSYMKKYRYFCDASATFFYIFFLKKWDKRPAGCHYLILCLVYQFAATSNNLSDKC